MTEKKEGILVSISGSTCTVESDGAFYPCLARGKIRLDPEKKPRVGDLVRFIFTDDGKAVIESIGERKNRLIRPPLSNLDCLFAVISSALPDPDLLTFDKLLCSAVFNGVTPFVIVSKCDLDMKNALFIRSIYETAGFDVFLSSPEKKDDAAGFILPRCRGKISAFSGVSGVGKTSLMNAVFPSLRLKAGEISSQIGRGKHTTRKVELFDLSVLTDGAISGYLADTPGFSMLDYARFDFLSLEDLPFSFPEFRPYLSKCRYTGCTHTGDEGCAVAQAVKERKIAGSRYDSYLQLYSDLRSKPRRYS